jgi:hypothetical protein
MEQFIQPIATTVLTLFGFFLLKNFWPKYFEEKGKNQATKEDIGFITEIVENIKSDLVKQNELLKAELAYSNQHSLSYKNEERNALIDYYKKISACIFFILRFDFTIYDLENYKDLKLMSLELAKRNYECDLAEAHVTLFIYDKEFLNLKKDLSILIIQLQDLLEQAIINYIYCCTQTEIQLSNITKSYEEKSQSTINHYDKIKQIAINYSNESTKKYKEIHGMQIKMRELINKKIIAFEIKNIS